MYRFNCLKLKRLKRLAYLNTTHVSVQCSITHSPIVPIIQFKYNPCIGSIPCTCLTICCSSVFKYNPCIGSMWLYRRTICSRWHLNTTHVSVQYHFIYITPLCILNLNTTHVSVQLTVFLQTTSCGFYLNTTHVSVQLNNSGQNITVRQHLNTTHVSVQLRGVLKRLKR